MPIVPVWGDGVGDDVRVSAAARWDAPRLDDRYLDRPSALYPAPVAGALDLLPLNEMTWEDFERLMWRIVAEVEGLREARVYGDRGQAQHGIDIVGFAIDRTAEAVQCKDYKRFTKAALDRAVKKFRDDPPPFPVTRLVIAVACTASDTAVVEAEGSIRAAFHPITFELWDQRQISERLRNQPLIVTRFFGSETARRFCHPYAYRPIEMPDADAVAMREALARGPERYTGAAPLLEQGQELEDSDPARAVEKVEQAQALLTDAGFPGHAAGHDSLHVKLLLRAGLPDRAVRLLLDKLWNGVFRGRAGRADRVLSEMQDLARTKGLSSEVSNALVRGVAVAEAAVEIESDPFGYPGSPPEATAEMGPDQARLVVLGGEAALANEDWDWVRAVEGQLLEAARGLEADDEMLAVRARLLTAEASDDWGALVTEARRNRLGYGPGALVHARYARHLTLVQRFEEADAVWDEAVADACLASRWADAAVWTNSRRVLHLMANPLASNDLWATEVSLMDGPPSTNLVPGDQQAQLAAASALLDEKPRPAVLAGQRALRHAIVSADLSAERGAHRVLGQAYLRTDEPQVAAYHFARSLHAESVKDLGRAFPDRFIDVTDDLDATNYWTVAYAYRLLAEQADLVPDDQIAPIAQRLVADLQARAEGTLVDSLFATTTSRYLNAVKLAAGIAERLPLDLAELVLQHFEAQPPVAEGHYRFHDDDEATAVAGVGRAHPELVARAVHHLVPMLNRSQSSRRTAASEFIDDNVTVAQPELEAHRANRDRWALSVLEEHGLAAPDPEVIAAAVTRLTTPLERVPGVFTKGTGAVSDALLVRGESQDVIARAVRGLLVHAQAGQAGGADRAQYLLAAAQLVDRLDDPGSNFDAALECAVAPSASELDDLERQMTHPLGVFRITGIHSSRPEAAYLAARLASTAEQKNAARAAAMQLISVTNNDYWVTRALQQTPELLTNDVGFLSGQGWALRSLAAITWCKTGTEPIHVGLKLARDTDPRVRRALAGALSDAPAGPNRDKVHEVLLGDPCFSVRRLVSRLPSPRQEPPTADRASVAAS